MLVNVYGSKELFVNEYRTLLADRLLSQYSCDTEKEIRYLELLKLRFGDSQLHYCEVMLKWINQHIKTRPELLRGRLSDGRSTGTLLLRLGEIVVLETESIDKSLSKLTSGN